MHPCCRLADVFKMTGELDPEIPHRNFVDLEYVDPPPVERLTSVRDAQQALKRINFRWMYRIYTGQPDNAAFSHQLQQWSCAFTAYLDDNRHYLDDGDWQMAAQLNMAHRWTQIVRSIQELRQDPSNTEWWDALCPKMEEIIDFAAAAGNAENGVVNPSPFFAFDTGINMCLYTVAAWCRDPRIRRKAIRTLRSANRQEGFWNGQMTASFAEEIMQFEERGRNVRSCKDIPAEARLNVMRLELEDWGAKATLGCVGEPEAVRVITVWRDATTQMTSGPDGEDALWISEGLTSRIKAQ